MAVEFVRGSPLGQSTNLPLNPRQQQPEQEEESYLAKAGRNLYRGTKELTKLVGLPGTIAQTVFPKESDKTLLPTMQGIEEKVYQPLEEKYLPKGYGKPQGTAEEISDMMFQSIPWIVSGAATSGLSTAAGATGRALTASLGIKGIEKAGGGPILQLLGGILGGASPGLLRKGVGFGGIRSKVIQESKKSYKQAEPFAQAINYPANDYSASISKNWERLHSGKSGIRQPDIKRVAHEIKQLDKDVLGGKVNVKKAWESEDHLYKLIGKETDPEVKKFLQGIRGDLLDTVINPAAKEYPKFGIPYKRGDNLHIGAFAPNAIRKVIEHNTSLKNLVTSPLAQMGLLGATGTALKISGLKGIPVAIGGTLGTRYLLRAGDMFMKSSEARKIMKDIGIAAINDDKVALAQYLSLFNKTAEDYEKETTGVEFVRGAFNQKSNQAKR